ncbi:MAG: cytidylate kinase-like family protein, partial [Lachnospiraceae bacterium]|nr:cytidylate kinase-like family protein [Lachnospiraceae bacterium]
MKLASEQSGIDEAMFAKVDEKMVNYNIFKSKKVYTGDLKTPDSDAFTSDDNLFNIQAKVLKQLAETESCVIIGRCANFILKDYPNVVSVFVHADPAFCREQALARVSISE